MYWENRSDGIASTSNPLFDLDLTAIAEVSQEKKPSAPDWLQPNDLLTVSALDRRATSVEIQCKTCAEPPNLGSNFALALSLSLEIERSLKSSLAGRNPVSRRIRHML
jgi:hypothetical protein